MADIRLRNINKEYILKRTAETQQLEADIADLRDLIEKPARIRKEIIRQLEGVKKKYGTPRHTEILPVDQLVETAPAEDDLPVAPVHLFLSREGYFKRSPPSPCGCPGSRSTRRGTAPAFHWEADTGAELLLFTNRRQCYKTFVRDFDDTKASVLGDYLPAKLEMEEGEAILWACLAGDYTGHLLFFFRKRQGGPGPLASYQTVTRRKKLTGAYSDKSPLKDVLFLPEGQEEEVVPTPPRAGPSVADRRHPGQDHPVHPRGPGDDLEKDQHRGPRPPLAQTAIVNQARYRARSLQAAGAAEAGGSGGDADLLAVRILGGASGVCASFGRAEYRGCQIVCLV